MSKRKKDDPNRPEVSSDRLAAFLESARLRRLTGPELKATIQRIFREAAEEAGLVQVELNPEHLPHRIMVAWRIARTMLITAGLCSPDETLVSITGPMDPSPWHAPFRPSSARSFDSTMRRNQVSRLMQLQSEGKGLPLLPPRDEPELLERWCHAAALIASALHIAEHETGLQGMQGFLFPQEARVNDVSAEQVLDFEEMIVEEMVALLADHSERAAYDHLRDEYGIGRTEASALLRLVRSQAMMMSAGSMEEKRALQEMRLEDFRTRARQAMSLKDELSAIREQNKVMGLVRAAPEDQAMQFLQVIRAVSKKHDELDGAPLPPVLPSGAPRIISIESEDVDPEDEDALREYDKEN